MHVYVLLQINSIYILLTVFLSIYLYIYLSVYPYLSIYICLSIQAGRQRADGDPWRYLRQQQQPSRPQPCTQQPRGNYLPRHQSLSIYYIFSLSIYTYQSIYQIKYQICFYFFPSSFLIFFHVQVIEQGAFKNLDNLRALRLDNNRLKDINGLVASQKNLRWLNVSTNSLQWFDFAFIPKSLEWLDIHNNKVNIIFVSIFLSIYRPECIYFPYYLQIRLFCLSILNRF